jgi:hypothetical protein
MKWNEFLLAYSKRNFTAFLAGPLNVTFVEDQRICCHKNNILINLNSKFTSISVAQFTEHSLNKL